MPITQLCVNDPLSCPENRIFSVINGYPVCMDRNRCKSVLAGIIALLFVSFMYWILTTEFSASAPSYSLASNQRIAETPEVEIAADETRSILDSGALADAQSRPVFLRTDIMPTELAGVVVDHSSGSPVPGARVTLERRRGPSIDVVLAIPAGKGEKIEPVTKRSSVTDRSGVFHFRDHEFSGRQVVTVTMPGFKIWRSQPLRRNRILNGIFDLGVIRLQPEARLRVVVRTIRGESIEGARLFVAKSARSRVVRERTRSYQTFDIEEPDATTGADGAAVLSRPDIGPLDVYAYKPGYSIGKATVVSSVDSPTEIRVSVGRSLRAEIWQDERRYSGAHNITLLLESMLLALHAKTTGDGSLELADLWLEQEGIVTTHALVDDNSGRYRAKVKRSSHEDGVIRLQLSRTVGAVRVRWSRSPDSSPLLLGLTQHSRSVEGPVLKQIEVVDLVDGEAILIPDGLKESTVVAFSTERGLGKSRPFSALESAEVELMWLPSAVRTGEVVIQATLESGVPLASTWLRTAWSLPSSIWPGDIGRAAKGECFEVFLERQTNELGIARFRGVPLNSMVCIAESEHGRGELQLESIEDGSSHTLTVHSGRTVSGTLSGAVRSQFKPGDFRVKLHGVSQHEPIALGVDWSFRFDGLRAGTYTVSVSLRKSELYARHSIIDVPGVESIQAPFVEVARAQFVAAVNAAAETLPLDRVSFEHELELSGPATSGAFVFTSIRPYGQIKTVKANHRVAWQGSALKCVGFGPGKRLVEWRREGQCRDWCVVELGHGVVSWRAGGGVLREVSLPQEVVAAESHRCIAVHKRQPYNWIAFESAGGSTEGSPFWRDLPEGSYRIESRSNGKWVSTGKTLDVSRGSGTRFR